MSHSWQPHGLQPTRLLRPWDLPGKSTGILPLPSPKTCLFHITAQKWIWGLLRQQLWSRPCPQQDCDNHRAKRRPCSTSSAGFCHHHASHMFYQRDNKQHTLRKTMWQASVLKTAHAAKNIRLSYTTQEHSHRKTALQDLSRPR